MKTIRHARFLVGLCILSALPVSAQFRSGSNGSYGPLNVTSNTVLDLPPDGIFNCTTINVQQNTVLTFRRNPLNTPVYLLATSNVIIYGTIDVSGSGASIGLAGQGGPGGFDGGIAPNGPGAQGGDGLGPGGGRFPQGGGAFSTRPTRGGYPDGTNYGNSLLMPLIGGSGGAGGRCGNIDYGGPGGGGAILIASDTRIDFGNQQGSILANGGGSCNSGGSGGAIRVVAPIVAGVGDPVFDVNPRVRNFHAFGASRGIDGGNGWIRVDVTNRFQYALTSEGGTFTLGRFMQVFPTNNARLDIIEAAGTVIPEGTPAGVRVRLPEGSPTNQIVKVQARDFTGLVPITVAVTPDAAPATRYDVEINMAAGNPATTNVNLVIPAGTSCRIYAWTR